MLNTIVLVAGALVFGFGLGWLRSLRGFKSKDIYR